MLKIKGDFWVFLFGLVCFVNTSHAALTDLGNGLVNDGTLNITWAKDANLFKTLCDANDPIATGFTTVDTVDATTVCDNNGAMTWNDAEAWVARLNTQNYLGHNDWQQPVTAQPDAACSFQYVNTGFPDQGYGYNCANIGSELNHLFYISLANQYDKDVNCQSLPVSDPNYCPLKSAPFDNTQTSTYWSKTDYAPDTTNAWYFDPLVGVQDYVNKENFNLFVWPVRGGQSPVAPATSSGGSLSLWGIGIMSLILIFVARRKTR